MTELEDLIRLENANSGLAFRERAYGAAEGPDLLRDLLALANAPVTGPRFLFLGVRDAAGEARALPGITERAWSELKRMLPASISETIEPPLKVVVRALHVDGALIGMLCLSECDDPPYLLTEKGGAALPAGAGWIRRGTTQRPLLRRDLQRMFEAKCVREEPLVEPRVGFAGDVPQEELTLPVLPLEALPSDVAAGKLRRMLEAKANARDLGRTTTNISRLVHARLFGPDEVYRAQTDESLRMQMSRAAEEHRAQDEHYQFEVRAHKLNLIINNPNARPLQHVTLCLMLPRIDGLGVAERLYRSDGVEPEACGYPVVSTGAHTISVQAEIARLPESATMRVFREAPRLWVREPAAGKTIPLDYTLHARELAEPLRDVLLIRITGEQAAASPCTGCNSP